MSRTLKAVAAAVALIGAASAHAQSNVSVYGLVDVSLGQFQASGGTKDKAVQSGNMTTSFLGFGGTEDLGNGLKAKFALEHFLRVNNGGAGRFTGDAMWARNAYVGLDTGYGSVTLGRNTTPFFVSALVFNAFGDSFGFSPTIRQLFTPSTGHAFLGDTGWNSSVLLTTKNYGGLSGNLIVNSKDGAEPGVGRNVGFNAMYFGGPLGATFAYQEVKNGAGAGAVAGLSKQASWQLGGSYDLGMAKLFGQYVEVKTTATVNVKTTMYSLGAAVPLAGGKVLGQYAESKAEAVGASVKNKTFSLGYDYNLSKSTDVYAVYMNDKLTNLSAGNTYAAGLRKRF